MRRTLLGIAIGATATASLVGLVLTAVLTSRDYTFVASAYSGDTAKMRSALRRGADPNAGALQGLTVLTVASGRGDAEVVQLLLSHGADPNLASMYGMTPLGSAIEAKSPAAVKALLDAGADLSMKHEGELPLDLARALGEKSVIELLKRR